MLQTPDFVANPPVLRGFWGLTLQNRGFGLQTPYFAQTLSFVGGSEGLGIFRKDVIENTSAISPAVPNAGFQIPAFGLQQRRFLGERIALECLNGPFPRMPWWPVFPLENLLESSPLRKRGIKRFLRFGSRTVQSVGGFRFGRLLGQRFLCVSVKDRHGSGSGFGS